MRAVDIIAKKRDGNKLSREEINWFINGYVGEGVADYQAAALLMAIFLQGADFEETAALTEAMMRSGDVYDLSGVTPGRTVDKHSTGGVGDKVSLILAPLAAACGVVVPMVSGRGLGHTGGTLDKLESIPGFNVRQSGEEFRAQLEKIGVSMIGQTDNFVPADKRLYALRDVTSTVESIPLICASIMSKKVASGAQALIMDVKTGSGAFMDTADEARELASNLRGVGEALGRPVRALITDMNQPLGRMVGNALEVREAIECLHGRGPGDLRELTLDLAAEMIVLSQTEHPPTRQVALEQATQVLDSGAAWTKFREMVEMQEGSLAHIDYPERLEVSAETVDVVAGKQGYIRWMDCRDIGNASVVLGAGRARASDSVDFAVGLEMLVRIGDEVECNQPLVRVYHRAGRGLDDCKRRVEQAIQIGQDPVEAPQLIKERIA